ncbi:DeoR/GlpR transcriptional regulator, partial [Mesorhizobium sp. USDA-HM6]
MNADNRRQEIADYIIRHGEARIDELVATFGVSRMTIHRHVDELARQGVLRKLHGAVSAQPSGVYESLFRFRGAHATAAKQALARAVLAEIEPGQVVLFDDSTTANAVGPFLPQVAPLTVVTNSLSLAEQLVDKDDLKLILLGGEYHPTYNAFIGHICESALQKIRVNLL